MSRPPLLPEQPTEQDTAKFLRRFSELVAIGHSASYLRHAAGLIDELIERVNQTEAQLRTQTAENADNLAQRQRAEAEAQAAREQLTLRDQAMTALTDKLAIAEHGFAAEQARLTEQVARAAARLAQADAELTLLRGQIASVGRSHALVPMETLRLLRAQFDVLSRDFRRADDLASGAMCEVGICTIDQLLAGAPLRPAAAVRASA